MQNYIILLFVALLLTGCETFKSTKRVVVESEYLRAVVRTGVHIDTVQTGDLTDEQLIIFTESVNEFQNFIDKWQSPTDALKYGGLELKHDYIRVKRAYIAAYKIVESKWGTYTKEQQDKMLEWHQHALKLDKAAQDHMKLEQYVDMAGELVHYGRLGLSLVLKTPI